MKMFRRFEIKQHIISQKDWAMRMVYRLILLCLIGFIVAVGCSDKPQRQLYEKEGAFSYDPPAGWNVVEFPGLKYRIAHGPKENNFAPNINVVDEIFQGSLDDYVDANLKNMEELMVDFEIIKRKNFKTMDNVDAVFFVSENKQQDVMIRQHFFIIESGKRKYVVTLSTRADGGDVLDDVFEKSMSTFRFH
ncbi:MAG: hypothetical protein KKD44_00765 [Proteobacteria bacterium]|nr:hypothetical protein [Pseudomonadota bacterium]